ncbi:MAG: hypothetical protein AAF739_09395 [Pseudomonadota bacterium]
MKTLALTATAVALAFGAASPAFASATNNFSFDASVVSVDGSGVTLSTGHMLDDSQGLFSLPNAQIGDTVRVNINDDDKLIRSVRVIG